MPFSRLLPTLLFLTPLAASAITVQGFSFEDPPISQAGGVIPGFPTGWMGVQPEYFDFGIFRDTGAGKSDHIDNLNGVQALFFFSIPGTELYQDLAGNFEVNVPYTLTVALGGNNGLRFGDNTTSPPTPPDSFDLRFYYRNAANAEVDFASFHVVYTAAVAAQNTGISINHLYDYSLSIPPVQATDPWANKPIGIAITGVTGKSSGGAYWDLDNVRVIPEPGAVGLLLYGAGVLALRRRRT